MKECHATSSRPHLCKLCLDEVHCIDRQVRRQAQRAALLPGLLRGRCGDRLGGGGRRGADPLHLRQSKGGARARKQDLKGSQPLVEALTPDSVGT